MDPRMLGIMIPIMALAIPVAAIVLGGMAKLAKLRLEEAKVRAGSLDSGADAELNALRADVDQMRQELGEVHERLDFTERLLARQSDQRVLKDGER